MKFVAIFFMIVLGCCNVAICDQLDRYASPIYRNSHVFAPGVPNLDQGVSYRFELIKKIDETSGYFYIIASRVFGEARPSIIIVIQNVDLSRRVDGDVIWLNDRETLWCIGTMTNDKGYTFRIFTPNRNVACKFVQENYRKQQMMRNCGRNIQTRFQ